MAQEEKVEINPQAIEQEGPKVIRKIEIALYDNGGINLNVVEGEQDVQPIELELLVRNVYEQLHEQRIAQRALELFKARLG